MPSSDPDESRTTRRKLLAGAGTVAAVGAGTVGYRLLSPDRDSTASTRNLAVEQRTAGAVPESTEGAGGGRTVVQRCDPDPERWSSVSHAENVAMLRAWNQDYRLSGNDSARGGVTVDNTLALDRAAERVDGAYLYFVRLYSLFGVENGPLSEVRLRRATTELAVPPSVDVRSVLPSRPVGPDDGACTTTLLVDLPSGQRAGYERDWSVAEGTVEATRERNRVTLSLTGDVGGPTSMQGLVELRSERPLSALDGSFEWTVRGEATRRGW